MSSGATPDFDRTFPLIIGGERRSATDGKTIDVINPCTEETITTVACATEPDVDAAVESANEALPSWEAVDIAERGRILHEIAAAMRERKEYFATLETYDTGRPISQSKSYVERCARYFEFYAGMTDKLRGDTIPTKHSHLNYQYKDPLGVTAQIIPWNGPLAVLGRSVAPALATGNVSVIKPAEDAPLAPVAFGELLEETSIPPGVVNVIPGYGDGAGDPLARHPDVDAISFTGSVETGRTVAKAAAENITPVHLELGGKSPNIVFGDADIETAVENAVHAFSKSTGQACSAGSRLLLDEAIYDEFMSQLVDMVSTLTIDDGIEDPYMGSVVTREQFEKVKNYIEIGKEEVGEPVYGGETLDRPGFFVEPTVFGNVPNDSRIAQEEIFGPVLCVIPFDGEADAIEIANDTRYGLAAGVFTSDAGRAHRVAREIDAGQVYVNEYWASTIETPFGGYKDSGYGREKGLEALDEFVQLKTVCMNIEN